jgi:hypothetical protein
MPCRKDGTCFGFFYDTLRYELFRNNIVVISVHYVIYKVMLSAHENIFDLGRGFTGGSQALSCL